MINWLLARGDGRALVSGHFADNPASGRVLAKLGFLPCGRDKMHCAGRGEKADHIMLARIA
jgi:RimJ/RimL family protein N-acetyltransferase